MDSYTPSPAPYRRPPWRQRLGRLWFTVRRYWVWWRLRHRFARQRSPQDLPHLVKAHATPLFRQLRAVDMQWQQNKATNLRLAAERLDGLLIRPGERFSFWFLVGRPSAKKGYLPGLVLSGGQIGQGTGGGLCQMGNLLYWVALHSPLDVRERWRHSYDVFPDVQRVLPFGSGATLSYNYVDLQLENNTPQTYQWRIVVGETQLMGELRATSAPERHYEVFEAGHRIQSEAWGGYTRHNVLMRRCFDARNGQELGEEFITANHAVMMYQPFLDAPGP